MVVEWAWITPIPLFIAFAGSLVFSVIDRKKLAGYLSISAVSISFVLALTFFLEMFLNSQSVYNYSTKWFFVSGTEIEIGYLVDPLSSLMLLIVSGISLLIFLYSLDYMEEEKGHARYFSEISLFSASMMGLVLANNFFIDVYFLGTSWFV